MRFSLAVAVVLAGISVSGLAQQKQGGTFKVKPSASDKEPKKAAPIGVAAAGNKSTGSAASANAKDLQTLEHQTAKTESPKGAKGKTGAPALKPIKDKPSPPMNFGGANNSKSQATSHTTVDPYRGRVRQKHSHQ